MEAAVDIDNIGDLVNEFHDLARQMLEHTNTILFTGQKEFHEEDVEMYAKVMADREPLVSRMVGIKDMVAPCLAAGLDPVIKKIWDDAMGLVRQVNEIDQRNLECANRLMAEIQSSVKGLNQGKALSNAYMHPADNPIHPSLLDAKQ
jgi:hypothetical protein